MVAGSAPPAGAARRARRDRREAHSRRALSSISASTLARVAVSFAMPMVSAPRSASSMGRIPTLDQLADPWLVVLLNLPALVIIVLAYVWVGLTETPAIAAVALNKLPN